MSFKSLQLDKYYKMFGKNKKISKYLKKSRTRKLRKILNDTSKDAPLCNRYNGWAS